MELADLVFTGTRLFQSSGAATKSAHLPWEFWVFLLFHDRGPLCLLRFELGVLTHGRLGTVEMVSEYIRHDQAEEVRTCTALCKSNEKFVPCSCWNFAEFSQETLHSSRAQFCTGNWKSKKQIFEQTILRKFLLKERRTCKISQNQETNFWAN